MMHDIEITGHVDGISQTTASSSWRSTACEAEPVIGPGDC